MEVAVMVTWSSIAIAIASKKHLHEIHTYIKRCARPKLQCGVNVGRYNDTREWVHRYVRSVGRFFVFRAAEPHVL